MKDIILPYDITKGLTKADVESSKIPGLTELRNMFVVDGGLLTNEGVVWIDDDPPLVTNFPYPQIFILSDVILFCTQTALFEVDNPTRPSSLYKVFETVKPGEPWSIADFGTYILVSNGACMAQKDPDTKLWSELEMFSSVYQFPDLRQVPMTEVVDNFNGQCFAGGVDNNWSSVKMESVFVPTVLLDIIKPLIDENLAEINSYKSPVLATEELQENVQPLWTRTIQPQGFNTVIPDPVTIFSLSTLATLNNIPSDIQGRNMYFSQPVHVSGIIYLAVRGTLVSGLEKVYMAKYTIGSNTWAWNIAGVSLGAAFLSSCKDLLAYNSTDSKIYYRGTLDFIPNSTPVSLIGSQLASGIAHAPCEYLSQYQVVDNTNSNGAGTFDCPVIDMGKLVSVIQVGIQRAGSIYAFAIDVYGSSDNATYTYLGNYSWYDAYNAGNGALPVFSGFLLRYFKITVTINYRGIPSYDGTAMEAIYIFDNTTSYSAKKFSLDTDNFIDWTTTYLPDNQGVFIGSSLFYLSQGYKLISGNFFSLSSLSVIGDYPGYTSDNIDRQIGFGTDGNFIIFAGGSTNSGGASKKVRRYNPANNSWDNLPDLPAGLKSCSVFLEGNYTYVFGGQLSTDAQNPYVYRYGPGLSEWLSCLPTFGTTESALVKSENQVVVGSSIYYFDNTNLKMKKLTILA